MQKIRAKTVYTLFFEGGLLERSLDLSNSGEFKRQTASEIAKSTLSSQTVQIHSLFRHGFIKKPKSRFNRNRK